MKKRDHTFSFSAMELISSISVKIMAGKIFSAFFAIEALQI
jgi:hypothetical protein